jgi:hypothetical protein
MHIARAVRVTPTMRHARCHAASRDAMSSCAAGCGAQ